MADKPPPSYEGVVGNPDSEDEDSRVECGVLTIHLQGLAAEDFQNLHGPMLNFAQLTCSAMGSTEERNRLIEISGQLEGECEVHAEILVISHLVRMGYRVIDKTRVKSTPFSAYSRITFVREPTWNP